MEKGILSWQKELCKNALRTRFVVFRNIPFLFRVECRDSEGKVVPPQKYNQTTNKQLFYTFHNENYVDHYVARCIVSLEKGDSKNTATKIRCGLKPVEENYFYLETIFVMPPLRDGGIGSCLLNLVIEDLNNVAKQENFEGNIYLQSIDTPQTRAFYGKWGAVEHRQTDKALNYLKIKSEQNKRYNSTRICPLKLLSVENKKPYTKVSAQDIICEREQ